MFTDLVKSAYQRSPNVDPQVVINHYLKQLGINPTQAAMARGAAQQRLAQKNNERPRHQAGGPGSATPANGGKRPRTLAEVHRKIRTLAS